MALHVYDYRRDRDGVLVTPEIRVKFMHMQPGEVARSHSHDLGVSVFLVLQGTVEFDIEGEVAELGAGQMCVALADEKHTMRCTSQEPAVVYLSVAPHVQPTHTVFAQDGSKVLQRYAGARSDAPLNELFHWHSRIALDLANTAARNTRIQRDESARLRKAVIKGDKGAAVRAREAMWQALYQVYKKAYDQAAAWNELIDHLPAEMDWPEAMSDPNEERRFA